MGSPMAKRAKNKDFDDYGYYEERSHWWIVPILLVAIVAAAYVGGMIYFKDHTMPNTTVNGEDVSNLTYDELVQRFDRDIRGWTGVITGTGINIPLTAADVDLSCNADEMASTVMNSADPMLWPIELTQDHVVNVTQTIDFDRDKLAAIVTDAVVAATPSTGAKLNSSSFVYNDDTEEFELADDVYATTIDGYAIYYAAEDGILKMESNVDLGDSFLLPNTDAQTIIDAANKWLAAGDMDLTLADTVVATITKENIASLISFDETGQPYFNYDALESWTRGPLSSQLDTYDIDRNYTRYDGKKVSVPAGTWGWMIDGASLAQQIYNKIAIGDNTALAIPTLQEADWVNYGGQDWGWSYMDIDLTEQHARLYGDKGVLLWESDIVSGTPDGVHETPEGAYYFTSKETNIRLVGPLVEGTPEWDREVAIWYGVVGDSIGLHSAQWRIDSEYGGDIYTWNGSHGCINIPEYKARELWDRA